MENIDIEKRIASSNRWGLVALLHEFLITKCQESKEAIAIEDYKALNILVNRNRDLLTELIILFKENDEVSTDLREIYLYINNLLTDGEIKRDPTYFEKIVEVIEPIIEGFKGLEERQEPNIITGLTYGKGNLEEHKKLGREFKG